jgi:serine/threonine-protein kinase HipA
MAIPPTRKYQSEGGPGVRQIADFLKTYSTRAGEDVRIFADALAFNWLIAGTDAHAKNYAVLIGSGGTIRLAPLYDLASVLPYPDFDPRRIRLAMKIGREYRLREIGRRQWQKAAGELRLDPDFLVARVRELVDFLSESVPEVAKRLHQEGLRHPILTRLVKALTERANDCKKILRT